MKKCEHSIFDHICYSCKCGVQINNYIHELKDIIEKHTNIKNLIIPETEFDNWFKKFINYKPSSLNVSDEWDYSKTDLKECWDSAIKLIEEKIQKEFLWKKLF